MADSGKPIGKMRSYLHRNFNIFPVAGVSPQKYEGWVFDRYRRVEWKTYPVDNIEVAIREARGIIRRLHLGQFPYAVHVDEGRAIREREEKDRRDSLKATRDKSKGGKTP